MDSFVMALMLLLLPACNVTSATSEANTKAVGSAPTIVTAPTASPTLTLAPTATPEPTTAPTTPPTPTPAPTTAPTSTPTPAEPVYSLPIGLPGRPLGEGFYIRDAYAVENTWFNPEWLHTAEDWYRVEGSSAGAPVYAVAAGEVVYAGANYPGRVVIIRHNDGLYAMYGHLDTKLLVAVGQRVARGEQIGTVGSDAARAPGHLHFEIRTFLTKRSVNGAAPRYKYRCGVHCPPGPGYWPIDAPEHPSAIGWRNPTHVIARRAFPPGASAEVVVATKPVSSSLMLWSAPPNEDSAAQQVGELALRPGDHFPLLAVDAGAEDTTSVSARGYHLWYRIALPDGRDGWAQAAVPIADETDSAGRLVGVRFTLLPAVSAAP